MSIATPESPHPPLRGTFSPREKVAGTAGCGSSAFLWSHVSGRQADPGATPLIRPFEAPSPAEEGKKDRLREGKWPFAGDLLDLLATRWDLAFPELIRQI